MRPPGRTKPTVWDLANADILMEEEWVIAHFQPGDREEAMRLVLENSRRVLMPRMYIADLQAIVYREHRVTTSDPS